MTRTLTFALAAILSLPAAAQQTPPAPAASPSDFVIKAAEGSMKALEAGMLAADKTSNAEVRALARHLIVDHSAVLDELKKLAAAKSITLTVDPKAAKPATGELAGLDSAAFDRAYLDQMIKYLEEAVTMFEAEKDDGKDKEIEVWADKKLETLEEHLKTAKEIQGKISR